MLRNAYVRMGPFPLILVSPDLEFGVEGLRIRIREDNLITQHDRNAQPSADYCISDSTCIDHDCGE